MPDNVFAFDDIMLKPSILSGEPESDSSNCSSQRSSPDNTTDEFDDHSYVFAQGPYTKERREQRQERQVEKKRKPNFSTPITNTFFDVPDLTKSLPIPTP